MAELVDTDGPFLAIPPLKRVWPQGMPALSDQRKDASNYAQRLRDRAENLYRAADNAAACSNCGWPATSSSKHSSARRGGMAAKRVPGEVPGVQARSPGTSSSLVTPERGADRSHGDRALVYLGRSGSTRCGKPPKSVGGHPDRPDGSTAT